MDTEARLTKLSEAISGSGGSVNDSFGIDASFSDFSDAHLENLAGWADLEMLHAVQTKLSDASIPLICTFSRLYDFSISSDTLTDTAFDQSDLPARLRFLSLSVPRMTPSAAKRISKLAELECLHLGATLVARNELATFASMPGLSQLGARNNQLSVSENADLSKRYPKVLMELADGLWVGGMRKRKWNA